MAEQVRNIAPFINVVFTVTSKWWTYRDGVLHRGLDIATSTGLDEPVYSMLTGKVLDVGYNSSAGNYIIIYDDRQTIDGTANPNYGYATRYLHLAYRPLYVIGASVQVGEQVGSEGNTGASQGRHLHVEMQDVSRFNFQWHVSNTQSDYLDPTVFMGIDNVEGTQWKYDGSPVPPPTPVVTEKRKFPWVLYSRKLRNKRKL